MIGSYTERSTVPGLAVVAGLAPASRYRAITEVLRTHLNASPYMEFYVLEALYLMGAATVAEERMRNRFAAQVADPATADRVRPHHQRPGYRRAVRPLPAPPARSDLPRRPGPARRPLPPTLLTTTPRRPAG
ncbi:hypothetical protein OIE50_01580 [Streptomyces canus]|uniref:hypothetical protein n=1 Tax=Streptomyces canus TaxID=58343 RepID=UPI003243F00E